MASPKMGSSMAIAAESFNRMLDHDNDDVGTRAHEIACDAIASICDGSSRPTWKAMRQALQEALGVDFSSTVPPSLREDGDFVDAEDLVSLLHCASVAPHCVSPPLASVNRRRTVTTPMDPSLLREGRPAPQCSSNDCSDFLRALDLPAWHPDGIGRSMESSLTAISVMSPTSRWHRLQQRIGLEEAKQRKQTLQNDLESIRRLSQAPQQNRILAALELLRQQQEMDNVLTPRELSAELQQLLSLISHPELSPNVAQIIQPERKKRAPLSLSSRACEALGFDEDPFARLPARRRRSLPFDLPSRVPRVSMQTVIGDVPTLACSPCNNYMPPIGAKEWRSRTPPYFASCTRRLKEHERRHHELRRVTGSAKQNSAPAEPLGLDESHDTRRSRSESCSLLAASLRGPPKQPPPTSQMVVEQSQKERVLRDATILPPQYRERQRSVYSQGPEQSQEEASLCYDRDENECDQNAALRRVVAAEDEQMALWLQGCPRSRMLQSEGQDLTRRVAKK